MIDVGLPVPTPDLPLPTPTPRLSCCSITPPGAASAPLSATSSSSWLGFCPPSASWWPGRQVSPSCSWNLRGSFPGAEEGEEATSPPLPLGVSVPFWGSWSPGSSEGAGGSGHLPGFSVYSQDPSCLFLAKSPLGKWWKLESLSEKSPGAPPPLSSHAFLGGEGGKPSGVTPNRQVLCGAQWPEERCSLKVVSPVALVVFARFDLNAAGTNPNCV